MVCVPGLGLVNPELAVVGCSPWKRALALEGFRFVSPACDMETLRYFLTRCRFERLGSAGDVWMTTLNKLQPPSVLAEKQCFPPTIDENVRPATGVCTVVDIGLRRKRKKEKSGPFGPIIIN